MHKKRITISDLGKVADMPYSSYIYRNTIANVGSIVYTQITNYVPRILAKLSKASIVKWILTQLGLNYSWLVLLLLAVL